jgi:hypothetical protein
MQSSKERCCYIFSKEAEADYELQSAISTWGLFGALQGGVPVFFSLLLRTPLALSADTIKCAFAPAEICRPTRENNMKDAHNKAAGFHEAAAKSHRAAAESHGKNDHAKGKEHSTQAQQHAQNANEHSKTANSKSAQQR